jgi:hypothetical protein
MRTKGITEQGAAQARKLNGSARVSCLLATLLFLACAPAPSTEVHSGASVPVDETPAGHAQQTFKYPGGWNTTCSSPITCQTEPIGSFVVATPATSASVDIQVTATLDYKVSEHDRADVALTYTQSPTPGPLQTMAPGSYRLASLGRGQTSSTTLTWARTDLAASGQEYYIQVGVVAHDSDSDGHAAVSGTKVVLVVEMWRP